jgi:hypothetical protein
MKTARANQTDKLIAALRANAPTRKILAMIHQPRSRRAA